MYLFSIFHQPPLPPKKQTKQITHNHGGFKTRTMCCPRKKKQKKEDFFWVQKEKNYQQKKMKKNLNLKDEKK